MGNLRSFKRGIETAQGTLHHSTRKRGPIISGDIFRSKGESRGSRILSRFLSRMFTMARGKAGKP